VAHHRRHGLCCVDFRFYSPESDHLKLWNTHPHVEEEWKVVVNLEDAETADISGAEIVNSASGESEEEVGVVDGDNDELWQWSSDEEGIAWSSGDNLKAFDLRASALRLMKAYVAVLDVAKTDCTCWVNEVMWPSFLRSKFKVCTSHKYKTL
jgi:hypothetical protein